MPLPDRQHAFQQVACQDPLFTPPANWRVVESAGISNRAQIIEGGLLVCNCNLNSFAADDRNVLFVSALVLPAGQEAFIGVFVGADAGALRTRLNRMLELHGAGDTNFTDNNKNVKVYLNSDGRIYLRNRKFFDSMDEIHDSNMEPSVAVDKIVCGVYAPSVSAYRTLLGREFVRYVADLIGANRVEEIYPWQNNLAITPDMCRAPLTFAMADLNQRVAALGGYFVDDLTERFHIGLNYLESKHFVILSGISGTGKSSLIRFYSQAIHNITDPRQNDPLFFSCAVRPDWTDPTGLVGYYDVISRRYVVPQFLQAMLVATANPTSPVFVCLDEMNLAHVEYYFADILSAIESGKPLQLHASTAPLAGDNGELIPGQIPLPNNLYIVGTINVDETTHPVSDKVLDRAVLIDMSGVDIGGFLESLRHREPALADAVAVCAPVLTAAQTLLRPHTLHFGYRMAEEFSRYYQRAIAVGTNAGNDILDHLILQKLLVKLRGDESQRELLKSLQTMLAAYPKSAAQLQRCLDELTILGSFQFSK